MIEYDVETTGLQPWSQQQFAFLHIFMDGDAYYAWEDYDEYSRAVEGAFAAGINEADLELEEVPMPSEEQRRWATPVCFRLEEPVAKAGSGRRVVEFLKENYDSIEQIEAWFEHVKDDADGIRAWNSKFDRAYADIQGWDIPGDGRWHDGMLVAHAVDERRSVALKAVASQLLGEEAADPQKKLKQFLTDERKRRKKAAVAAGEELIEPTYRDVPMDIMEPYALEDVILTRKVSDRLQPTVDDNEDLAAVVEFERPVMDALYAVEKRGLPAREKDYRALENEVVNNLEELEAKVFELAPDQVVLQKGEQPTDFNPRSSAKIIAALKERGANMKYMEREEGKIKSADADNLRAVDDELALAILKFRSEFKVLSTYVRPMLGRTYNTSMRMWKEPFIAPDGRIHANYRQVGARTGRMSCSDPNMQNQPRDDLRLRYCVAADPGYKLVAVDLKNIEMMLFAAYAGNGRLLEAVRAGEDLHMLTAKMLQLQDRQRADGNFESARQLGKTYNFSRIYGGGLRTIRKSFRCDMEHARLLKRRFDDAYPEVRRLGTNIEYRLRTQGYISDSLFSRRRYRVAERESYKATNYLVQGAAASLFKKSLVAMHAENIPVVALVHDEIVAHVPEAEAEETAERISYHLTNHPKLTEMVPLSTDADICDRWSDAKPLKVKDAEGNETGETYLFKPSWVKE